MIKASALNPKLACISWSNSLLVIIDAAGLTEQFMGAFPARIQESHVCVTWEAT